MSDMTLDKLMFLKFFFKLRKDKVFWSLNHISSLTIFYNVVVHFKYSLRFIFGSEHDLMQTVSPKRSNLIIWYFWKLSIYCLIYLFCLDNFEKIIYCLDKKIWQIIRTPSFETQTLVWHCDSHILYVLRSTGSIVVILCDVTSYNLCLVNSVI